MPKKIIKSVPVSELTVYQCDYCNFTDKKLSVVDRHQLQQHECNHELTEINIEHDWDGHDSELHLRCMVCNAHLDTVDLDSDELLSDNELKYKIFNYLRFRKYAHANNTKLWLIGCTSKEADEFVCKHNLSPSKVNVAYDPDNTCKGHDVKFYIHMDDKKIWSKYMKETYPNAIELKP